MTLNLIKAPLASASAWTMKNIINRKLNSFYDFWIRWVSYYWYSSLSAFNSRLLAPLEVLLYSSLLLDVKSVIDIERAIHNLFTSKIFRQGLISLEMFWSSAIKECWLQQLIFNAYFSKTVRNIWNFRVLKSLSKQRFLQILIANIVVFL